MGSRQGVRAMVLAALAVGSAACGTLLGLDSDATLIEETESEACREACDDGDPCTEDRCRDLGCAHEARPDGPADGALQVAGDCSVLWCRGGQASAHPNPEDVPDPGPCAVGRCAGGVPELEWHPRGEPCPGGVCDGQGHCVECLDDGDCDPPDRCGGGGVVGECGCAPLGCAELGLTCGSASDGCYGVLSCDNGAADASESDIDCGGDPLACERRCDLGQRCGFGTDCASGLCEASACARPWSEGFGDSLDQRARAMAVSRDGEVVVAGEFAGKMRFGDDVLEAPDGQSQVFVARVGPGGAVAWSKRFGDGAVMTVADVAIDGAGNVIVVGSFTGDLAIAGTELSSGSLPQAYVFKLDHEGFELWARQLSAPAEGGGSSSALAVTVDSSHAVVVGGEIAGTVTFSGTTLVSSGGADALWLRLSPAGALETATSFGGAGQQRITAVTDLGTGEFAVGGDFSQELALGSGPPVPSQGDWDLFLARLSVSGAPIWTRAFTAPGEQHLGALTVDGAGDLVVAGNFFGAFDSGAGMYASAGGEDLFVLGLRSSNGALLWAQAFGGPLTDHVADVAIDPRGDLVIAGHFGGSLAIGATTLVSTGGNDAFVAKLDAGGGARWARRFGGASAQLGVRVGVAATGTILLLGDFRGSIDFGQGPLASAGAEDVFLAAVPPTP